MAQPQPVLYTPSEYLALEREAQTKSEYLEGQIFALAGASRHHNLITLNIAGELRNQLRHRPCEVYPSDMRVKVSETGLYTYSDVVVVCGEPQFEDTECDTLLNPTILIEVLSKSTADYDRGAKFEHYRSLRSLQEVLFIAQDGVHVVHYRRKPDETWILTETRDPQGNISLPSVETKLEMSEVYAKVQLDPGPKAVRKPVRGD